jgi:hypothetical protein
MQLWLGASFFAAYFIVVIVIFVTGLASSTRRR